MTARARPLTRYIRLLRGITGPFERSKAFSSNGPGSPRGLPPSDADRGRPGLVGHCLVGHCLAGHGLVGHCLAGHGLAGRQQAPSLFHAPDAPPGTSL